MANLPLAASGCGGDAQLAVKPIEQFGGRESTLSAGNGLAIANEHHGGHSADAELKRQVLAGIDINRSDAHARRDRLGGIGRAEYITIHGFARAAPGGSELYQQRLGGAVGQHGFKVALVVDCRGRHWSRPTEHHHDASDDQQEHGGCGDLVHIR